MSVLTLPRAQYLRTPWKNGGGVSEQIAIEPASSSVGEPFVWRMSMARIESRGLFSRYSGYERRFAVWEGEGVVLEREREKSWVPPFAIQGFDGDETITCDLVSGPVTDWNLIYDPKRVSVITEIDGSRSILIHASTADRFVVCVKGSLSHGGVRVNAGDTLHVSNANEVSLDASPGSLAILVYIGPANDGGWRPLVK